MKTTIAAIVYFVCLLLIGCTTQPKIESTKQWEGHYMTVSDFQKNTIDIQLDKDESIWIMSNYTLNRLLKNTGK